MEEVDAGQEASAFRALADPTRRQILEELRAGDMAAGEIAGRFPISGPSVSRHLGVLKAAGLVRERRAANRIIYSLAEDRLALCVSRFLSVVCPEQVAFRLHARLTGHGPTAGDPAAGDPATGDGETS
jgi:DNA-binding transcriptional ArsR family regulator